MSNIAASTVQAPAELIRVGITEWHGMAHELAHCPPPQVRYSLVEASPTKGWRWIGSPIKGYLRTFQSTEHDLIEAVLSPIITSNRWIYSLANLQEATAFNLLGLPLPRAARVGWLTRLLLRPNLKKILFWSEAGKATLESYGRVRDERLLEKVTVVYPAIRSVPDESIRFGGEQAHILFSGDFFRKGGAHVVDAFERAQQRHPHITLQLCCDEKIDFNTPNEALRSSYLARIRRNPAITFGRVRREEMIEQILPRTDIYALPTYVEAFGYAILEAMAFGIPVISTNHFAIPEIVADGASGFLIDTRAFDCERLFRGYLVKTIPKAFHEYMTEKVYEHLCALIESPQLRERLGRHGLSLARSRFSVTARNERMLAIYREALA